MRRLGLNGARVVPFAVMLILLPILVTACGPEPAPEPTATILPTPTPTATDLLEQASRRLAETESVHYTLHIEGDTFLDNTRTIRLLEAEGDLQRPDRVYSSFRAEVMGQTITLQLITVGAESWTTDILSGEWVAAPQEFAYSPAVLFDNQEGIGPVMDRVSDAERLDDDEINGRAAYHIRADVDQDTIGPLTSYLMTGPDVTVDLWLDEETADLLRAQLSQPSTEENSEPTTWTLDLSHHGEGVTIEPPV